MDILTSFVECFVINYTLTSGAVIIIFLRHTRCNTRFVLERLIGMGHTNTAAHPRAVPTLISLIKAKGPLISKLTNPNSLPKTPLVTVEKSNFICKCLNNRKNSSQQHRSLRLSPVRHSSKVRNCMNQDSTQPV